MTKQLKGKRPPTYGPQPKARVKRLLEVLLSYLNQEFEGYEYLKIDTNWQSESQVVVKTKSGSLEKLTERDPYPGRLTKGQIQEALHTYLKNFLGILEDHRIPTQGSEDLYFTLKLWHNKDKNKNLEQFNNEWESRRPKKSKAQEITLTSNYKKTAALNKKLDPQLEETLKLYLAKSFNDDGFAELDQAGETDPDRRTPLKQVFVDLNVEIRKGLFPRHLRLENLPHLAKKLLLDDVVSDEKRDSLSAMNCLLKEFCSKVVIIGGPGQGKSTLGQQLAQVHRAKLLCKPYNYQPQIERIPFRVILKYFAQWLANNPLSDDLELYLAERIGKLSVRPGAVSTKDVQEILHSQPSLLILDGLDEVVVPELQERMLARIHDFLDRAEQLNANLMVVATSRPKEYKDKYEKSFDPEQFWHLELGKLSREKVIEYSEKWVPAKNLSEEEQHRIIDTIQECQEDRSISALLTTPLQVTIILLIIKDGGRPPSQREALFDEYWRIIFRREKSKAKGIIQSDESILFDLHSYFGYLLHSRASKENAQSLLAEEEFRHAIREFLRKEDSRSSEDAINSKIKQLIGDAQERLVLIVAPEPGFFGFELRSFQEFFAAVYLAQTATDTQQRFERLKAIAYSEHWRNVALFFAGRIARNFRGEASNILELVCRPMDRGEPNRYLRPGCWFALEIAADGALNANRDLQYNAIEYGLEVLETSLTGKQHELESLTKRLSKEDQNDILRFVLEEKIYSLPLGYLEAGLKLYGEHFGASLLFLEKVDKLLKTKQESVVFSALSLALNYESEPSWMVEKLHFYWDLWKDGVSSLFGSSSVCNHSYEYTKKLLKNWRFSDFQTIKIAEALLEEFVMNSDNIGEFENIPSWNISKIDSVSDQLIAMLECFRLTAYLRQQKLEKQEIIIFETDHAELRMKKVNLKLFPVSKEIIELLNSLLQRSNLTIWFKISLLQLLCVIKLPNYEEIYNDIINLNWDEKCLFVLTHSYWHIDFWRDMSPILLIVLEKFRIEGLSFNKKILSFLKPEKQIYVSENVIKALQDYADKSTPSKHEFLLLALEQSKVGRLLPQLLTLGNKLDVSAELLLISHLDFYRFETPYNNFNFWESQIEEMLKIAKSAIEQPKKANEPIWEIRKIYRTISSLMHINWAKNPNIMKEAQKILELLLDYYPNFLGYYTISDLVHFFLKLLAYDNQIIKLTSRLFTTLPPITLLEISYYSIRETFDDEFSSTRLFVLESFLNHEEEAVRLGSALILKKIKEAIKNSRHYSHCWKSEHPTMKDFYVEPGWGWSFANSDDSNRCLIGIALLSLSDYPIVDINYRHKLLAGLQKPRNPGEEKAWIEFLEEISIPNEKQEMWCSLLKEVLDQPWNYSNLVLSTALERYKVLTSDASAIISDAEEKTLRLL